MQIVFMNIVVVMRLVIIFANGGKLQMEEETENSTVREGTPC